MEIGSYVRIANKAKYGGKTLARGAYVPAYLKNEDFLVFTGWELRTWTGQGKEKKSCGPTSVTAAERRLTPESGATARSATKARTSYPRLQNHPTHERRIECKGVHGHSRQS